MTSTVNIIAIGGGKGGIGKSVIATNLAVGLALGGQHVVLIDTDFGASNLHALLGISNPTKGFLDFFAQNEKNPNSLLLDTGISNLKFVSGAGDNLGSANLEVKLQEKIINFISNLNANHILLDLGPGTSYNVIDYFNIGTQGVVLAIPEMPSVMNAFSFIKNTLFRLLSQELNNNVAIKELMDFSKNPEFAHEMYSMDPLKKRIEAESPGMESKIDSVIASFKPNLILNRVRKKKDLLLGKHLQKLVKKYLNVDLEFLGYLVESDKVRDSVNEMIPFLIKDPQSKPSENLQRVIGALTHSNLHLIKKDGAIFVSKQIRLSS
ncbi:MAG: P-loop NTPase, partial [Nitrospinales bacterium]